MKSLCLLIVSLLVLQGASYCSAQCLCRQTCNAECCIWEMLDYDNTTESLSDIDGTPYGYGTVLIPGLDDEFAVPCIRVEYPVPEQNPLHYLFVAVESRSPGRSVCIEEVYSEESRCDSGTVFLCVDVAPITSIRTFLDVRLSTMSEVAGFEVYYRMESATLDVNDEDWCDTRMRDVPSDLLATDPSAVTPTLDIMQPPDNMGGGALQAFTCDCNRGTGTCVPDHGDIVCRCIGNWTGSDCSQFICDLDNPCQNGGSCVEDRMDRSLYLCVCPTGFTGPYCQFRTNQSACMTYSCDHGTCFENTTSGQPICLCEPGYWGVSCENANTVETPDPCQDPVVQQCHGNGVCAYLDGVPFFACNCDRGWDDFTFCQTQTPIDYCHSGFEPCEHGGTCVPRPESFNYHCECPGDYTGVNCTVPFDVCASDPCQHGGTCQPIEGGHYFSCFCPPEFSGKTCEGYADPCLSLTCQNGSCVQDAVAVGDGVFSSNEAHCECACSSEGVLCENDVISSAQSPDTSDVNCSVPFDVCASDPCQHGGTCQPIEGGHYFSCFCPPAFSGETCEGYADPCLSVTCQNGSCVQDAVAVGDGVFSSNEAHCECACSSEGVLCENDVISSAQSPDTSDVNCSVPFDVCASDPCQHGGTCQPIEGGHYFSCFCPPAFSGETCEGYADPCLSVTCQNGSCVQDAVAVGDGVFSSNEAHCECACSSENDVTSSSQSSGPCRIFSPILVFISAIFHSRL